MTFVEFTKEMKKDYTILAPDMTTIHFKLLECVFHNHGYKLKVLRNQGQAVVDEGLKYVHNDTCYPALLSIGQMLDALNSGEYDLDKTALLLVQTGGGCRASNYTSLLRKALDKAGYGYMPVISLNFNGLEHHSGFKISLSMLRCGIASLAYGDLLMLLSNQTKPYEIEPGASAALVEHWIEVLSEQFRCRKGLGGRQMKKNLLEITRSFADIPVERTKKVRVGVVGEIYVKYAALGNNNLEQFLYEQGCEVMVPGLVDFMLYFVQVNSDRIEIYGGSRVKLKAFQAAGRYIKSLKTRIDGVAHQFGYVTTSPLPHLLKYADSIINRGCVMGEGWLLTAEMLELFNMGYENIICVQPFGCLPNHIVGKGMMRAVKQQCPNANIVAIDYDASATRVNQENRIKLMLAVARDRMNNAAAPMETE